MKYTIHVENFGKIKKADIRVAPMTLLVGDNNSGKSYLLSLIWALQSYEMQQILYKGLKETQEYVPLEEKINSFIESEEQSLQFRCEDFLLLLNKLLTRNKDKFVEQIFNSSEITIGNLSISTPSSIELMLLKLNNGYEIKKMSVSDSREQLKSISINLRAGEKHPLFNIVEVFLTYILLDATSSIVYFPAARTGFMLAKEAINKAARKNTFDTSSYDESIEPFTKPILNFLDVMNILSLKKETSDKNKKLLDVIHEKLSHGLVCYKDSLNKNLVYYPQGSEKELPLRTVSAVVTELAPLMLLLQYQDKVHAICYEEPEMCLHPQLQLEMAKLLVKMVNSGIYIIATTHSDIILQHINNACKLFSLDKPDELLAQLGMTEDDCLAIDNVAVYQFHDMGNYSEITELKATRNGFDIPTFKEALQEILNQTTEIYTFEEN